MKVGVPPLGSGFGVVNLPETCHALLLYFRFHNYSHLSELYSLSTHMLNGCCVFDMFSFKWYRKHSFTNGVGGVVIKFLPCVCPLNNVIEIYMTYTVQHKGFLYYVFCHVMEEWNMTIKPKHTTSHRELSSHIHVWTHIIYHTEF